MTDEKVEAIVLDNEKIEETNTPEVTATEGQVEDKQVEPEKTFSQAELDAVVKNDSQRKNVGSQDGLKRK